MLTMADL